MDKETNDYFDLPVPENEQFKEFLAQITSSGYNLDKSKWQGNQSEEFYKGMYSAIRIASSLIVSPISRTDIDDIYSKMGIDILYLIAKAKENK